MEAEQINMERVNRILKNERYQDYLSRIQKHETDRIFCGHDMSHFCDVARLAYLMALTQHCEVSKEMIYAAALLHDIGRFQEYETGIRHEIASAQLAPAILEESGFDTNEINEILDAIRSHRNKEVKEEQTLRGLIYRADKMSRACFGCQAESLCDWDREKKNLSILL